MTWGSAASSSITSAAVVESVGCKFVEGYVVVGAVGGWFILLGIFLGVSVGVGASGSWSSTFERIVGLVTIGIGDGWSLSGVTIFGVSIFWVGVEILTSVARTRCIRRLMGAALSRLYFSFAFLLILSCCFCGFYNSYHNVIQEL